MAASTENNDKSAVKAIEALGKKIDSHVAEGRAGLVRMDRLETKIDQLADAVIAIARAEEKIAILMQDTSDIKESIIETTMSVHRIDMKSEANSIDLKTLGKFFWIVIGGAVSITVSAVSMSLGIIK